MEPWRSLSLNSTRFTIAHELLHLKYPRLEHGDEFKKRTKKLVDKWKEKKK
jgi:predicted metal-dependent hydrolase